MTTYSFNVFGGFCSVTLIFKSYQCVSGIENIIIFKGETTIKMQKRFIDCITSFDKPYAPKNISELEERLTPTIIGYFYSYERDMLDTYYKHFVNIYEHK